jgi:hypothetical protein
MPKPPPGKVIALIEGARNRLRSVERKMAPPPIALLDFARKILENARSAMAPGGKVALLECVVTGRNEKHFSKFLDIEMIVHAGGRERTKDEYAELFTLAGLRLTRVIPTAGPASVIEAEVS